MGLIDSTTNMPSLRDSIATKFMGCGADMKAPL